MEKCFEKLKASGQDVSEIVYNDGISAKQWAEISRNTGIEIVASHTSFERIATDIERLSDEHLEFGAKIIGIGRMPMKYGFPRTKGNILKFADVYNKAAEKIKSKGCKLAFHNHASDVKKVWFGKDKLLSIILDNTVPEVEACLDVCWAHVGGAPAEEWLNKYGSRISILHLKDWSGSSTAVLGKGIINMPALIDLGIKVGTKYAVLEEETREGDKMENIIASFDYLNTIKK